MKEQSFTGLWWLPSTPDVTLSGTLDLTSDGRATLRLVGMLSENYGAYNNPTEYPLVLGFSDSGKMITLVEAATNGFSIHAPGMPTEELIATLVLIGAHFQDPADLVVNTAYAEFTHLPDWIGPGAVQDNHDPDHFQITWTRPSFPSASVGDTTIGISPGFKVTGDGIRERGIEPKFSIRFEREGALEPTVRERIRPFQNLLTLGVGRPNVITAVRFKTSRGETARDGDLIEAVFRVDAPPPARRAPSTHDMLFALRHVESDFEPFVQGWYRVHAELEDVCNLYFTTLAEGGPLEVQFLNLVRAVEVFDRLRNGNQVLPKDDHRAMVREIVEAVPDVHRDWLKEKLAFSNEPTLRVGCSGCSNRRSMTSWSRSPVT